jgi:hypothetical protein
MTIAQDIRNAFDRRDDALLLRALKKLEQIEALFSSVELQPKHHTERCTCAPEPSRFIATQGEPLRCAECRKPVSLLTFSQPVTAAVGIPLDMQGVAVAAPGTLWNGPVDGQGRPAPIGTATLQAGTAQFIAGLSDEQLRQRYVPAVRSSANSCVCGCPPDKMDRSSAHADYCPEK